MNKSRFTNIVMWALCGLALALVVFPAVDIIVNILVHSVGSWSLSLLTTQPLGRLAVC